MTSRQPDLSAPKKGKPPVTASAAGESVASPEFLELARRVLDGRTAFQAEGLSARGTRVLQALGYLAPVDLFGSSWEARPGEPGLRQRAMGVPGCGPATLRELQAWFNLPWGPQ